MENEEYGEKMPSRADRMQKVEKPGATERGK